MADARAVILESRAAALSLGIYAAAAAIVPNRFATLSMLLAPVAVFVGWWTIQTPARWLVLFLSACILLPPLNLPLGNAGPHPALIAAALGIFVGALRLREWTREWDALSVSFVAFFAVLLSTVPLAGYYSGLNVALGSFARVALFGISVYVFLFARNGLRFVHVPVRKTARGLLWIATLGAAFACLDFYFQFPAPAGFGPQFVWLDSGVFRRAQGLFYEASTLGNFCVFFLVMIVLALFKEKNDRPASRLELLVCGSVLTVALVLSYSRASLGALAVAVCAAFVFHRRRLHWTKLCRTVLVVVLTAGGLLYLLFPAFAQTYWTRLALSIQWFYSAPNAVLSGRLQTWQQIAGLIAEDPWLAFRGIGYKTLPYTGYFGRGIVADNMYLSLLVETGIIGLGAFAFLNWNILRSSLNAARSRAASASFLGMWFFSFWLGELLQMLSGDLLTYWRVLPVYLFILAMSQREIERRS
jgi:O-antigen ligase